MIRHIAIFLCSLLMCSTTFADSVTSVSLGALLTALNERMLLMKDVAAYKMKHHLPIEDSRVKKMFLPRLKKKRKITVWTRIR